MLCGCQRVHVNEAQPVTLTFHYEGTNVEAQLTDEEAGQIMELLDGKTLHRDQLACGFDENISLMVGDKRYCPACDGCCFVKDAGSGMYFKITQAERNLIDRVFAAHGGQFPCI